VTPLRIKDGGDHAHHTKIMQCREANLCALRSEDAINLRANAFARECPSERGGVADCIGGARLNREPKACRKACGTQGSKCIFFETLRRVANGA
jgi:hypothetical protein